MTTFTTYRGQKVALLLPCLNEASAIGEVISAFREAMPELDIFVFDNLSSDATVQAAREAGARVRIVPHRGKGNVVRRMFADLDRDIYVMADGDATYDPRSVRSMVNQMIDDQLDMVVARRVPEIKQIKEVYRPLHAMGNWALSTFVRRLFGGEIQDMLSGYRVLSRRFVKSFPALSSGFEIETELTIHALVQRMPIAELPSPYFPRKSGSFSKLSTFTDGAKIAITIFRLYVREKPLEFFSLGSILLALTSLGLSLPILTEYLSSGLVPRLPTAILCATLMTLALLSLVCGLILNMVTQSRRETARLFYVGQLSAKEETA